MSDAKLNCTTEQYEAITTIDRNVSVSAGAGSGKTFVLVQRFMHIMEKGNSADSIMAITFTRKAANEMKSRLRKELQKKIDSVSTADPAMQFWQEQLKKLERAQISTFDSLYGRILRENPVEAQVDPGFITAEGFDVSEFESSLVKWYIYDHLQDESVRKLIDVYGLSTVVDFLRNDLLYDFQDIAAEDDLTQYYASAQEQLETFIAKGEAQAVQLAQDIVAMCDEVTNKTGLARLQELSGYLAAGNCSLATIVELLKGNIFKANGAKNPLDGPTAEMVAEAKAKREKIINIDKSLKKLDEIVTDETVIFPIVQAFHEVIKGLYAYMQEQKDQAEMFGFSDIQKRAIDLLANNEEVRHKYQKRFQYIMVDEFQDTNNRQRQLIYWLCGDSCDKLLGNKLFIVGDAKQSIYRFRGAEVSVFARVRKDIKDTGGVNLELSNNFRSRYTVLEACNSTFIPLMDTDNTQDVWFEPLNPKKTEEGAALPTLLRIVYDKDDVRSKFEAEAEAVAAHIRDLCDKENVAYDKIAILMNVMTHISEIQQALQKYNIPYQVVDGRGFFHQQEVLDLLNILTVLDNTYSNAELAGVLRSPYFGLNDTTITKLFLQNRKAPLWDKLREAATNLPKELEQQALVERAYQMLLTLEQDAALMALPELLHAVWQNLQVDAVLSRQQYGAIKLANAIKLRDDCLDYAVSRQVSLHDWLDYINRLRNSAEGEKINMANLNDVKSAVTIMTIHKSKGLEFDTVFVPFLSSADSVKSKAAIMYSKGIGLGIQIPQEDGTWADTSVMRLAKEMDLQKDTEERMRKLYVAMTRAEERLVLSGLGSDVDNSKELASLDWMKQLERIFEKQNSEKQVIEQIIVDALPMAFVSVSSDIQEQGNSFDEEAIAQMEPLPAYVDNGQTRFTPSALQTYEHCERAYFYQEIMGLPEYEEEVVASTEDEWQNVGASGGAIPPIVVGLVAHRTMELYHGNLQAAFKQALEEQKKESIELTYANQSQIDEIYMMLERYVQSSIFQNLPAEKRQLRETKIRFALPNGLSISGIIDFLAEREDGSLMIMDYKTGTPPTPPAFNTGYAYQLALYKMAVEAIYGKPVTKAVLHYLQDISAWELPMDTSAMDYHDFTQEAQDLCMSIHQKGRDEERFACTGKYCEYCGYKYICTRK